MRHTEASTYGFIGGIEDGTGRSTAMRIGINLMLWTASPSVDRDEKHIRRLKKIGYGAFELGVGGLDAAEISRFARLAEALDMEVQALDLFPASEADPISPDPAMRRKAIERTKLSVRKARDIGSRLLSGPFFQALNSSTQLGPTEDELKWSVEGLRAVGEEAAKCGILIAAEPLNRFEMHIVNTLDRAYALCLETGLENVGLLADTHHANIEELDPVAAFVRHADRIYNIHISESNRGIPGSGRGIPPELPRAMLDASYQGNFIIEAFNANVPETLPLLRIWAPLAESEDAIAVKGYQFIKQCLN